MHLSNVKLWNFRKFGSNAKFAQEEPHLDLDFNAGLNVLIGEMTLENLRSSMRLGLRLKHTVTPIYLVDWSDGQPH